MKKKFILCFFLFAFYVSLFTFDVVAQPTQEWVRRFSGNGFASGLAVKLDSSGNVYVLLKLFTDTTLNDYGLLKYDPSGNLLWSRYYNSPGNFSDNPKAFAVSRSGDVYITGSSGINFTEQMLLVKFSTDGMLQWNKTFQTWYSSNIMLDRDNNVIVIGGASAALNTIAALTVKLNSNGDSVWVNYFMDQSFSHLNSEAVIDDSNSVYTCGYYKDRDYLMLKYSENGNLRWNTTYNSPQNYTDNAGYLDVDSNRNVYIVGANNVPGAIKNNTLIKLNSSGSIQWTRIFTGIISGEGNCGSPAGLVTTSDGTSIYYTTFAYNGVGAGGDIITLKYNTVGDTQWVKRYSGGVNSNQNGPSQIKLDFNNNVYVTGIGNYQVSGDDYVTIKYLPSGVQQWTATYNGPLSNSFDYARDIIIDTNLNVYVTGISSRFNGNPILWDAATIKYSQPIGINNYNSELPTKFRLCQNYPNPFNSTTIFSYEIPRKSNVKLVIHNIIGQLVKTLVSTIQNPGYYRIDYDASKLASGIYFYQLIADNKIILTDKFALIK